MSSSEKTVSPITTRSGMSLGRNLFKLVVPYLSPQSSIEQDKAAKGDSISMESSVDKPKIENELQIEVKNDDLNLEQVLKSDSKMESNPESPMDSSNDGSMISTSDMFKLDISQKVYEESDDEWPIREALIFRYNIFLTILGLNFNLDNPYITAFSYDFGPSCMHPSDFVKSCNDVAIGHALRGILLINFLVTSIL